MEDHRHLTEPRTCHFTDILLGPVYAILRQSPVYAILFSQRNHLNFLSDTGAHYSVTLSVQASTATLLYLVKPFTCWKSLFTAHLHDTWKRYAVQSPPFLVTINLHVIYIILKSALEHDHVKYHLQDIYIVHGKISVPRKFNLQSSNTAVFC